MNIDLGVVASVRSTREVATSVVLDELKEALDALGLDARQRASLHAILFELVEGVVDAVREGEAEARDEAVTAAMEQKELEHERVLAEIDAALDRVDGDPAARVREILKEAAE